MIQRHYNYIIVGCCFLFLFANLGMGSTAFSVHQPYLVSLDGVGDTGGSLVLSTRTLTSLIALFFVDRYYELFDIRRGVFLATLCTAIGFAIESFAASLGTLMFGAVFLGFGYGIGGMVAVTYIASRWFSSGLGSMVGFAAMGSGMATIIMPIIIVNIIEGFGLAAAFRIESAIVIVIAFLMLLVLRNRPSDLGMAAYETRASKKRKLTAMEPAPPGEHLILMVAMVCVGIFSCCAVTYISVLGSSNGFDPLFCASLVSIAGISLTISKFVTGELFDHLGVATGSAIVFGIGMVGYGFCCTAGSGIAGLLVAGAILVGAGISLGSVGISVWSIDLSNPAERTKEIRNFQLAYTFGALIAHTLPGIIKDITGNYMTAYGGVLVLTCVAAFIILRYYRRYSAKESA